ncbi:MAG: hypothetical protein K2X86_02510 [Cytophagaceae bacterium]|nr:hypothetical protein [Cytophagaceae bacterium]
MENYHEIEIIFNTRKGFTYRCKNCEYIQIELGNFIFASDPDSFYLFKCFIDSVDLNDEGIYQKHLNRKIVFEPFLNRGFYCFSKEEILELKELLNGTIAMLEIDMFLGKKFLKQ